MLTRNSSSSPNTLYSLLVNEIEMKVLENITEVLEIKRKAQNKLCHQSLKKYIKEMKTINYPPKSDDTLGHPNKASNFMIEDVMSIDHE